MELRKAIAPDLTTAEQRYPEVLNAILDYTKYCDEHGDEELVVYKQLEERLHQLTDKDMKQFNLYEWWEEEGAEVLAFRISLPDPVVVTDLLKEELKEIVGRLKTFEAPPGNDFQFHYHLDNYYHAFLALNCKAYNRKLFQRNKNKEGNYVEYSAEEIVEKIWR